MTTIALTLLAREASRLKTLLNGVSEFVAGLREGHAMAQRYDLLSRMSDGQLARHGLTRDDIPRAVVTGRYKG